VKIVSNFGFLKVKDEVFKKMGMRNGMERRKMQENVYFEGELEPFKMTHSER